MSDRWSAADVESWVQIAKRGETVAYHHGDLAADRIGNRVLGEVAGLVYNLAERGIVHLTQKRRGSDLRGLGLFDYRMTRRG